MAANPRWKRSLVVQRPSKNACIGGDPPLSRLCRARAISCVRVIVYASRTCGRPQRGQRARSRRPSVAFLSGRSPWNEVYERALGRRKRALERVGEVGGELPGVHELVLFVVIADEEGADALADPSGWVKPPSGRDCESRVRAKSALPERTLR